MASEARTTRCCSPTSDCRTGAVGPSSPLRGGGAGVAGGRGAIERAKDVVPDVVLLDVHMPDGSGIEAAEQIATLVPGVAVVLFSGDQTITLSERGVAA